tara:strand:+ start:928 stop:1203 length:276 start_codon:yes stop_codon:yes gene_type:complete
MTDLVYNIDMTNNNTINEREIKMTLTPNELLAMVNKLNERPMPNEVELDEVDMRCDEAEYEYHEANWEDIESDDGHRELYDDLDICDTVLE